MSSPDLPAPWLWLLVQSSSGSPVSLSLALQLPLYICFAARSAALSVPVSLGLLTGSHSRPVVPYFSVTGSLTQPRGFWRYGSASSSFPISFIPGPGLQVTPGHFVQWLSK